MNKTNMTHAKSILITGCSSGIGLCVAEGLRARGYRVFATARKSADVAALQARGLESLHLDVDDSASISAAVDEVLARCDGRLYALFNNAGYGQQGAVEDLRREVLRAQFETNLFGLLEVTNHVLPAMRTQGYGRIINNSSVLGMVALPYRGAYNASKFAIEGLSDTLRMELSGTGILVSIIEPGPIETKFRENALRLFRENIDMENSHHRAAYHKMGLRLNKSQTPTPFTLPPEAVLKKLIHALESPRPNLRYYVTAPTVLFAVLKRLLPYRALDGVVRRIAKKGA